MLCDTCKPIPGQQHKKLMKHRGRCLGSVAQKTLNKQAAANNSMYWRQHNTSTLTAAQETQFVLEVLSQDKDLCIKVLQEHGGSSGITDNSVDIYGLKPFDMSYFVPLMQKTNTAGVASSSLPDPLSYDPPGSGMPSRTI